MIITQRGHAANMDARHRRGTEIHRHLVRLLVCEGIQNSLPTRRGSGSRLKRRHRGNPHRLDLMRSRRCSNQAVRYGAPGTTWIRDQPRNPPKYTEKRIRINFPFPCPSRGRAHARRVGSPARRVGSFRGYAFCDDLSCRCNSGATVRSHGPGSRRQGLVSVFSPGDRSGQRLSGPKRPSRSTPPKY